MRCPLLGGPFTFLSVRFHWQRHNFLFRLVSFWLRARDWNVIFGAYSKLGLPRVFCHQNLELCSGNLLFQGLLFFSVYFWFFLFFFLSLRNNRTFGNSLTTTRILAPRCVCVHTTTYTQSIDSRSIQIADLFCSAIFLIAPTHLICMFFCIFPVMHALDDWKRARERERKSIMCLGVYTMTWNVPWESCVWGHGDFSGERLCIGLL